MPVDVVTFPETRVALLAHRGPPWLEHDTVRKLIEWKIRHRLLDAARHRSYGLHYTDPRSTPQAQHRVAFCLSVDELVVPNEAGIVTSVIPALRCARARHLGSRAHVAAAEYLYDEWLPASGERLGAFPVIFHYVNVGPGIRDVDMVTDVYLPLADGCDQRLGNPPRPR